MSFTSERAWSSAWTPHKRSPPIEVMSGDETIVDAGRFGTDLDGYAAMKT